MGNSFFKKFFSFSTLQSILFHPSKRANFNTTTKVSLVYTFFSLFWITIFFFKNVIKVFHVFEIYFFGMKMVLI